MPAQPHWNQSLVKQDNSPVVASRYGFQEVQMDGGTYLTPMTKEEYIECLKSLPDFTEEQLANLIERVENNTASCFLYTTMVCATPDNCQVCQLGNVETRYFCYCLNP